MDQVVAHGTDELDLASKPRVVAWKTRNQLVHKFGLITLNKQIIILLS